MMKKMSRRACGAGVGVASYRRGRGGDSRGLVSKGLPPPPSPHLGDSRGRVSKGLPLPPMPPTCP